MSESRDTGRSAFSLLFGSPLVFSFFCLVSIPVTGLFLGTLWALERAGPWHVLSSFQPALWFACILSVHVQLLAFPREPSPRGGAPEAAGLDDEVLRYHRLRSRLERFLVFSATIIGMATLSLGTFRNLTIGLLPSSAELFTPSTILIYGVYYTGLLASTYLPTRQTLRAVG